MAGYVTVANGEEIIKMPFEAVSNDPFLPTSFYFNHDSLVLNKHLYPSTLYFLSAGWFFFTYDPYISLRERNWVKVLERSYAGYICSALPRGLVHCARR